jgi:hypothetical protein
LQIKCERELAIRERCKLVMMRMHLSGTTRRQSHAGFASIYSRKYNSLACAPICGVDYASIEVIIARELGKRGFRRIPIKEAVADFTPGDRRAWTPDLVSVSKEAWQTAVKRFKTLKPLLELDGTGRTLAKVSAVAAALETAIKNIYLTEEQPDVAAVIEEVNLQCFPSGSRVRQTFIRGSLGTVAL